jgi:hypothetical protein
MAQDNRKGTPQSDRDRGRQNPAQGPNPGSQGHNPHRSAIADPGKRSQPGEKRNQDEDVDNDVMDEDRNDADSKNRDRDRNPSGAGS